MNRKNRFYVNVENKKINFFFIYGICKRNAIIKRGGEVLRVYRVVDCPYGQ